MKTVQEPPATAVTMKFLQLTEHKIRLPATMIQLCLPNSNNLMFVYIRINLQQSITRSPREKCNIFFWKHPDML